MKIAFLNDGIYKYAAGFPSAVGGAERQQWLLARALAASNWSVSVGVFDGIRAGKSIDIEGVNFTGLDRSRSHALAAWFRFIAKERPTWLYWRGADHLLGPIVAIAKGLGSGTIFSAAVDSDVTPRLALSQPRWWLLYQWGLSWSDRIFVQHGRQLSSLSEKLRKKAFLIPSIAGGVSATGCQRKREKYVAWVGQLRQPKRPDLLVDIARMLSELQFVVCGGPCTFRSPPMYSEGVIDALQTLPNVKYYGQLSPPEAERIIGEAAILLSTADEEGFPNTFLQSWSHGTPVVSLKIDPDGVIERRRLGIVMRDTEAAASTIRALIHAADEREEIGRRARRYVEERHSQAVVTRIFNDAVHARTQPPSCRD